MAASSKQSAAAQSWSVLELVGRYQADIAIRNNLWTTYVVASFAAAGLFATSNTEIGAWARSAVSFGFLAFSLGHVGLLYSVSKRLNKLEGIFSGVDRSDDLGPLLSNLSEPTRIYLHLIPHAVIDGCVLIVIWASAR